MRRPGVRTWDTGPAEVSKHNRGHLTSEDREWWLTQWEPDNPSPRRHCQHQTGMRRRCSNREMCGPSTKPNARWGGDCRPRGTRLSWSMRTLLPVMPSSRCPRADLEMVHLWLGRCTCIPLWWGCVDWVAEPFPQCACNDVDGIGRMAQVACVWRRILVRIDICAKECSQYELRGSLGYHWGEWLWVPGAAQSHYDLRWTLCSPFPVMCYLVSRWWAVRSPLFFRLLVGLVSWGGCICASSGSIWTWLDCGCYIDESHQIVHLLNPRRHVSLLWGVWAWGFSNLLSEIAECASSLG